MFNIDNALRTLKGALSRVQAGKPAAGVMTVLTLACLGLTACGSSGSSTNAAATGTASTSASTPTSGSSTQGNRPGGGSPRFAAMRECLQKNGITLPKRTPGTGGPAGGGFPGAAGTGGPQLPQGVTRAQYEAALKKCGGWRFGAGGGHFQRANSPIFKQALAKFGACLRQNGVNLPAPNTSGKGPIFSTKGIDTTSPQFKAATAKCRSVLTGAFRRPQGANGAPGGGAPPSGGQAAGGESAG
jgi:hypothetical protein